MSRKKSRAGARKGRPQRPAEPGEQGAADPRWQRLSKPTLIWIAGVMATVVAAVVAGLVTWVGPEAVDSRAAKDVVREAAGFKDDFRHTVTHENGGWVIALPAGAGLTPQQRSFLEKWSLENSAADGYTLDRLAEELRAAGGADVPEQTLRLALEGRRNQPIRVSSVKPVNIRRTKPHAGTLLIVPPQDSGNTLEMMFNFDEVEPQARIAESRDGGFEFRPGGPFFQKKTITIKDAVEDVLVIRSVVTRWAVSFDIRIDYYLGDQAKFAIIDNDGHPFSFSPTNCVERSRNAADGTSLGGGYAGYEHVWALRDDFQGIEEAATPNRYPLGSPYC
ncbi:hypothetical protein [Micromonospora sp. DT233]|uniref:hypothetical protein n=1 Tax=Micromonospora sp. DT233 TaxID=3393432 RepID=UPI003CF9929C